MADIYNEEMFLGGRWRWSSCGYERYLKRGCQFTDIDGFTESSGQHLIVESKHWNETEDPHPMPLGGGSPMGIPTGQWIALQSLRRQGNAVWLLYGDADGDNPMYLVEVGVGSDHLCHDLVLMPLKRRRTYLKALIGLWQADADGRAGIDVKGFMVTRDYLNTSRSRWEAEHDGAPVPNSTRRRFISGPVEPEQLAKAIVRELTFQPELAADVYGLLAPRFDSQVVTTTGREQ